MTTLRIRVKHRIALIFAVAGLASCGPSSGEQQGQLPIVGVEADDSEMNKAMEVAQNTLQQFDRALASPGDEISDFALKVRYEDQGEVEHIWTDEIQRVSGGYTGIVGNIPEMITTIALGDSVLIDPARITDWMYLEGGKLRGGYTIRVLRNRMSLAERQQFDAACEFIIEEEQP